jgi:sulfate/thiosulfate transport system ATP-binding protein
MDGGPMTSSPQQPRSVTAHNLERRFSPTTPSAVAGVSFHVATGSLLALLGPSGAGKTTLLRLIAGLDYPNAGRIHIGTDDITDLPARQRGLGVVFQHYALFPHLNVFENVAFPLRIRHQSRDKINARVHELLALVHLEHYANRRVTQLSGGQAQRVALARALAPRPSVLLLDEPFGALDIHVRHELRHWLAALHDDLHVTTILVTHDQEEAFDVADQIAVLRDGRIEQIGAPNELLTRPSKPFVEAFLSPLTRSRSHARRLSTSR